MFVGTSHSEARAGDIYTLQLTGRLSVPICTPTQTQPNQRSP
jgi:hypothetical protein